MRVANRIFTERVVSQVEVVSYLLRYTMEFANNNTWTFLNVPSLTSIFSGSSPICSSRLPAERTV